MQLSSSLSSLHQLLVLFHFFIIQLRTQFRKCHKKTVLFCSVLHLLEKLENGLILKILYRCLCTVFTGIFFLSKFGKVVRVWLSFYKWKVQGTRREGMSRVLKMKLMACLDPKNRNCPLWQGLFYDFFLSIFLLSGNGLLAFDSC